MPSPGRRWKESENCSKFDDKQAKEVKKGLTTNCSSPPSILSTTTTEVYSFRQYLIEDFLYSNVGDQHLLQIGLDHPNFAS
jgi:hypothetical protein